METTKKFRYTKQLINMALRDGWTQKQIAETCRTQQSIVSSWKNGSKQAQESQLKKLLDLYGSKLRRKTSRIYHAFINDNDSKHIKMIKVEGEIIFTFPFRNIKFCPKCSLSSPNCRCNAKIQLFRHTCRFIVHAMGKGEFCLVFQSRLINDEFQSMFPETNIYNSQVLGRYSAPRLLEIFDVFGTEEDAVSELLNPTERLMAKMLIRKALLEQGQPLDGIEEHLAAW